MSYDETKLFDLIKTQYVNLGEDGFGDWWHSQDPSTFEVIQKALGDPAFGLLPHQKMPPGRWRVWFLRMGRGSGKTFGASCAVHRLARDLYPGGNGILVGATVKDVRDTMIEGDSGLIETAPPGFVPHYNKHDNVLVWPNGSRAIIRTADNPEDIRGPTLNWGWADELVKWRSEKSWDNLKRCVRNRHEEHGARLIVTTTPQRAKQWMKDIESEVGCIVSTGSTLDNAANLDDTFIEGAARDVNTTRGREEVLGEWVEGVGQLWTDSILEDCRITNNINLAAMAASMQRLALSVDPSSGMKDECGIVLVGRKDGRAYVLADWSEKLNINDWTDKVVMKATEYLRPGDVVLLEVNNNAAAKNVLEMKHCPAKIVPVTQTRGKYERAEECFVHFHEKRVKIMGTMTKLEMQLKEWEADQKDSPDRGDAMTQGLNYLLGTHGRGLVMPVFNLPGFKF